jgi:hypothetical protein
MYRSSRLFISQRLHHSKFFVGVVNVKRHAINEPNMCLANANLAFKIDVLGSGSKENRVIAGWLAHKYDPDRRISEFVQHWWNFDPIAQIYFDTTPLDKDVEERGFEYIIDEELFHIATTQLSNLEHTVGRDIVHMVDGWHSIEFPEEGEAVLKPIFTLSVDKLMHFKDR